MVVWDEGHASGGAGSQINEQKRNLRRLLPDEKVIEKANTDPAITTRVFHAWTQVRADEDFPVVEIYIRPTSNTLILTIHIIRNSAFNWI